MSAIWHAKPKQGKTLLTATLLAKAAVGDPSIADFVKVRPDRIIFLADDGGRWSQTLGWMRTAVRNVPGGLDELESRLRIFPRFKLIQEEHKKAVYDLVKNGGEVVVVADCLVSINDGYDTSENDSSFTRPLRRREQGPAAQSIC